MKTITREELSEHFDGTFDMPVVEVLSEEEYEEFHLPGAINVPIDEEFEERIQEIFPDKTQPVVVYCASTKCNASEEAAEHMDQLGYTEVYDYEAGKADWKKAGLPVESLAKSSSGSCKSNSGSCKKK